LPGGAPDSWCWPLPGFEGDFAAEPFAKLLPDVEALAVALEELLVGATQ
jgi:hypothetical protein